MPAAGGRAAGKERAGEWLTIFRSLALAAEWEHWYRC
jgi:hypothetical protein